MNSSKFTGHSQQAVVAALGLMTWLATGAPCQAAERVVLTYGAFQRSLSVSDLTALAEQEAVSRNLKAYLKLTKTSPTSLRSILNSELTVGQRFLDKSLNTLPGEFALFHLGTIIHTPARVANIEALRSAVVLSTSRDNKLSLLEFLQNYPTQEMYIDGLQLLKVGKQVNRFAGDVKTRLAPIFAGLQDLLSGLICDCPEEPASSNPKTESSLPQPALRAAACLGETQVNLPNLLEPGQK